MTQSNGLLAWTVTDSRRLRGGLVDAGRALAARVIDGTWDEVFAERLECRDPELSQLVKLAIHHDLEVRPTDGAALH